ncbi:MAG: MauE/DoxX family redox-associated membrane protein [Balneola sp.]
MEITKNNDFWINGPRILVMLLLIYSIFEKLLTPSTFYLIVKSLDIHVYAPEFILAFFITIELSLLTLLFFKPNKGILYSAYFFILYTALIGILHLIGIRELCGNKEVISTVLGLSQILQNIGIVILLLSSWYIKNKTISSKVT